MNAVIISPHIWEEFMSESEAKDKRIAELEERLKFNQENHDALVARWEPHIADMEAKLDAVQPLPDKWRKYTFDNPKATSYIDSADCADELEEALGEAK